MQTFHRIVGWVGTSMTATILAFLPGYLSSHSPSSLKVMIGCAIGSVVCGIVWFVTRPKGLNGTTTQTTHGNHSPIGGSGDHSMTAGGDIKKFKAKFLTYNEATPAQQPALGGRGPSKLVIHSANYMAIAGEGTTYDVADCLRQMIKGDRLDLDIENHNFITNDGHNYVPKDPKVGTKKRLRITYSYDGGFQITTERPEGHRIELPESRGKVDPPIDAEIPKLLIRSPQMACLSYESQMITRLEIGEAGMIVRVENPEAAVGRHGIAARDVVAILRFYRPSGEIAGTSEYAFWMDIYENRVTIQPGTSRELVIGVYSNPKVWKYFTNKRVKAPQKPYAWSQIQIYMERMSVPLDPQLILMNPTIDVQLTLMSGITTLAKKSFKLFPVQNSLGQTIDFMFEELL